MENSYITIGELAARLGIARWKLAYWIERGMVPRPSVQVPGRRLFSQADVEGISARVNILTEGQKTRR